MPLDEMRTALHERLLADVEKHALAGQDRATVRAYLEETLAGYLRDYPLLGQAETEQIVRELCDDIVGFGPLEPLLQDPHVTDIMVNRHDLVYVQRHGLKTESSIRFRNETHLRYIIARIAQGFRAHAALPPVAVSGPCLAIRLFPASPITLDALVAGGALSAAMAAYLTGAVRHRANLLFTGGTGAGKTSLMNACAASISAGERVLTIEEAAELRLPVVNWIRWETRPPNIEGKGEITQTQLLRNALRQNPDRIIVGEVRGGEALDMLQAMNTGHSGSMSTLHASGPVQALDRLELLARWNSGLPGDVVRRMIAASIEAVVHLERLPDGRRAVVEIAEVAGMSGDAVQTQTLFRFERPEGAFAWTGIPSRLWQRLRRAGIPVPALGPAPAGRPANAP